MNTFLLSYLVSILQCWQSSILQLDWCARHWNKHRGLKIYGSVSTSCYQNRKYLRNRKHFPCFYQVIETRVEVWENEKYCGNTSRSRVFPHLFQVLPNFHECFYYAIEIWTKCFLFLLESSLRKITKNEEHLIALFIIKMCILYTVQFTCHKLQHHLCVSFKLQKHDY